MNRQDSWLALHDNSITSNSTGGCAEWSRVDNSAQALCQENAINRDLNVQGTNSVDSVSNHVHLSNSVPCDGGWHTDWGTHSRGDEGKGSNTHSSSLVHVAKGIVNSDLSCLSNTSCGTKNVSGNTGERSTRSARVNNQVLEIRCAHTIHGQGQLILAAHKWHKFQIGTRGQDLDSSSEHVVNNSLSINETLINGRTSKGGGGIRSNDVIECIREGHGVPRSNTSNWSHCWNSDLCVFQGNGSSRHNNGILKGNCSSKLEDDIERSSLCDHKIGGEHVSSDIKDSGLSQDIRQNDSLKRLFSWVHGRYLDGVTISILWHSG